MLERMLTMIGLDQDFCMQIFHRFPRVITVWVSFPLDQVLELTLLPKEAVIYNGLNLVFRVFIDEIWGWSRIIGAMSGGFSEGG